MTEEITYKRLESGADGECIKVTHIFSSHDPEEMAAFEEELKETIGGGIVSEVFRD